jgi:hypothetical protein
VTNNEATARVVATLDALGIAYMLVGSYSANNYGVIRATKDADIVVTFGGSSIGDVAQQLAPDILLDPQIAFESVTGTTRYIFKVATTPFQIELFRLSEDPHDQERFQRRRRGFATQLNREACFPTAEDVIITKLRWALNAARNKDRDDVRDVVTVQSGVLDWPYIYSWCDQHGTRALLDEIRASIPELDS